MSRSCCKPLKKAYARSESKGDRSMPLRGLLGILGVALLSASCRLPNPAFLPENQGGAQESTAQRVSTAPKNTTQDAESTDAGSQGETTTTNAQSSDPRPTTVSSATTASSSGLGTTNSSETNSASMPTPAICDGTETYCYALNLESATGAYPERTGKGPPLMPVQGEGTLSHQTQSDAGVFSDFIRVDGGGRVRIDETVNTGVDGSYGFDVTVREIGCTVANACYLSVTGELALRHDVREGTVECVSFSESIESGKAQMVIEPKRVNNFACFGQGDQIHLFVNGEAAIGFRSVIPAQRESLQFNVGAPRTSGDFSLFMGDIGRFRYWTSTEAMQLAVKAGK